ncbi:nucleoside diphosphate kinase regulator [Pseudochelatococcus sp. B33]
MTKSGRIALPKIVIGDEEHERLSALAASIAARQPEIAEELLAEMERARVVKSARVPADVVRMNSEVEFETGDGQRRRVTLVYPGEADISTGRISILTPIGTALIGLSTGQSFTWTARDGREQRLTVLSVGAPAAPAGKGSPVIDLNNARHSRAALRGGAGAAGDDDPGPSAA